MASLRLPRTMVFLVVPLIASCQPAPPPSRPSVVPPAGDCRSLNEAYQQTVTEPAALTCTRDDECECVDATLAVTGVGPRTAANAGAAARGRPLAARFTEARCETVCALGDLGGPRCVARCTGGRCVLP